MITPDEYRSRLLAKLDALVAVLAIAIKKIEHSMTQPDANEAQLGKICVNLRNTMAICLRAKRTLEKQTKASDQVIESGMREYTEMSSVDEYRKFQSLPPIQLEDIAEVDLVDLCDKLQAD